MHKLILLAGLLLVGCVNAPPPAVTMPTQIAASASAPAPSDPIAQLASFTIADLQNADTIAVASNDAIGHACFPALAKFVQGLPTSSPAMTVSGALSAFEAARTARLKIEGQVGAGVPDYLKLGCAALVQDEKLFVLRLAALAGAGATTAGLAPMAGSLLPIVNSALPIPLP